MENLDNWRAAQSLIREHDEAAAIQAAMHLEQAVKEGNMTGREKWKAVLNAVNVLIKNNAGPGKLFN